MSEIKKDFWKICNSCKKPINFAATYYLCNVSTCNQKRTGWVFCKVECWDAHVPKMNHRESWAIESVAPQTAAEAMMKPTTSTSAIEKPRASSTSTSSKNTIIRRPK